MYTIKFITHCTQHTHSYLPLMSKLELNWFQSTWTWLQARHTYDKYHRKQMQLLKRYRQAHKQKIYTYIMWCILFYCMWGWEVIPWTVQYIQYIKCSPLIERHNNSRSFHNFPSSIVNMYAMPAWNSTLVQQRREKTITRNDTQRIAPATRHSNLWYIPSTSILG